MSFQVSFDFLVLHSNPLSWKGKRCYVKILCSVITGYSIALSQISSPYFWMPLQVLNSLLHPLVNTQPLVKKGYLYYLYPRREPRLPHLLQDIWNLPSRRGVGIYLYICYHLIVLLSHLAKKIQYGKTSLTEEASCVLGTLWSPVLDFLSGWVPGNSNDPRLLVAGEAGP